MTNNNLTAELSLTNAHGLFTADADKVSLLLIRTASWPVTELRRQVQGCCGYDPDGDALRDCTWLELCIIWVDSGNYIL